MTTITPPPTPSSNRRTLVVVLTGLSGAGRTTALHALEDLGFFCIDNLPTLLAPNAIDVCESGGITRVALGIDVRVRAFLGEVGPLLSTLEDGGRRDLHVLFIDASDEMLLRRFSESRRPHALATSGTLTSAASVIEGISLERERLAPVRARATRVIDTTNLSVHDLRRTILAAFGPSSGTADRMTLRIMSFGFKYGPPVDADLVFDVRFLKNPYFVPELKRLPGTDERVRDYVLALSESHEFLERILDLLRWVIPKYEREGKSYLTIGFGCTGGMHRSVVLAEFVAGTLDQSFRSSAGAPELSIMVEHRDIGRGQAAPRERMISVAPTSIELEHAVGMGPRPPGHGGKR